MRNAKCAKTKTLRTKNAHKSLYMHPQKIALGHHNTSLLRERSCLSLLILEGGQNLEQASINIYCLVLQCRGRWGLWGGLLRRTIENIVFQLLQWPVCISVTCILQSTFGYSFQYFFFFFFIYSQLPILLDSMIKTKFDRTLYRVHSMSGLGTCIQIVRLSCSPMVPSKFQSDAKTLRRLECNLLSCLPCTVSLFHVGVLLHACLSLIVPTTSHTLASDVPNTIPLFSRYFSLNAFVCLFFLFFCLEVN